METNTMIEIISPYIGLAMLAILGILFWFLQSDDRKKSDHKRSRNHSH